MRIEIIYKESEKLRYVYTFEVYEDAIIHKGTMVSRRNGRGDTWGDMWSKKFAKEKEAEENLRLDEMENEGCYSCAYEYDRKLREINDKYNPLHHKTDDGYPYYSGIYGNMKNKDLRDEYKLKMSNAEIKAEVIKRLTKKLKVK